MENDRQRLPIYTERFTVDVIHGVNGFLYNLGTKVE